MTFAAGLATRDIRPPSSFTPRFCNARTTTSFTTWRFSRCRSCFVWTARLVGETAKPIWAYDIAYMLAVPA